MTPFTRLMILVLTSAVATQSSELRDCTESENRIPEWLLSTLAPVPESIHVLADQIRFLEHNRAQFTSEGPFGFHPLRGERYGTIMLALAKEGKWDDALVLRAWKAVLEAEAEIGHSGSVTGLRNAAEACNVLGRHEEAIKWQERYVRTGEVLQPEDGLGYMQLSRMYIEAGRNRDAQDILHKLVARPSSLPSDYYYCVGLLLDMGEHNMAQQYVATGVRRFQDEIERARGRFKHKRVLVDPSQCDKCEGNPRWQWYELGTPLIISVDKQKDIDEKIKSGYIDITTEAQELAIRLAESHFHKIQRLAIRLTSQPAARDE